MASTQAAKDRDKRNRERHKAVGERRLSYWVTDELDQLFKLLCKTSPKNVARVRKFLHDLQ